MRILKKGMVGEDVKTLQQYLGISMVDGSFGTQTENAVKKFQKENNLVIDGIVGQVTWSKIANSKLIDNSVIFDPLKIHITKFPNRSVKYIIIHYTAGVSSKEGSARKVKNIFEKNKASADFCVDDKEIIQFNPDLKNNYTWAVGDNKNRNSCGGSLYGKVTNKNSISIEICSNLKSGFSSQYANHDGWFFTEKSILNAVKLTQILMKKFNIPIENVIRHFDVTGKLCPGILGFNDEYMYTNLGKRTNFKNNSEKWKEFKNLIKNG